MDKAKYKILLPEDVEFFLEEEVVQKIPYLKNYFNQQDNGKKIKVDNIRGQIFSHIVTHIRSTNIDPDDWEFTNRLLKNLSGDDFFELVIAAKFLGINSLVDASKQRFLSVLSTNDPDRIRSAFKIKYDLDEDSLLGVENDNTNKDSKPGNINYKWDQV